MPEVVGRLRTPRLPSAPASPAVGEMYYDTTANVLYWWNGTAWTSASGGAAGSTKYTYTYTALTGTPNSTEVRLDAAPGSATKLRAHQTSLGTLTMYDLEAHARPGSIILMPTSNRSYSVFLVTTSVIQASVYLELGVVYMGGGDIGDVQAGTVNMEVIPGYSLPTGGTAGQVLTKTSATNYASSWQAAVEATGWRYNVSQYAGSNPTSGQASVNNTDLSLVTTIRVYQVDADGVTRAPFFDTLDRGGYIVIQTGTGNNWVGYRITAPWTWGAGIYTFTVAYFDSGSYPTIPGVCTLNWSATPFDLRYNGAWSAGTYKDGDIAIYNGIAYMAVRTTTQTPAPWVPSPSATTYATTLPASPVDGQEAILVDSVTNPNYQWRFRYNAGNTTAYKWEYVGGAPYAFSYLPSGAMAGGWTTYNPQTTFPRSGIYQIAGAAVIKNVGASVTEAAITPVIAGGFGYNTVQGYTWIAAGQGASVQFNQTPFPAVVAGNLLTLGAYVTIASNMSLAWLSIEPVRVS